MKGREGCRKVKMVWKDEEEAALVESESQSLALFSGSSVHSPRSDSSEEQRATAPRGLHAVLSPVVVGCHPRGMQRLVEEKKKG